MTALPVSAPETRAPRCAPQHPDKASAPQVARRAGLAGLRRQLLRTVSSAEAKALESRRRRKVKSPTSTRRSIKLQLRPRKSKAKDRSSSSAWPYLECLRRPTKYHFHPSSVSHQPHSACPQAQIPHFFHLHGVRDGHPEHQPPGAQLVFPVAPPFDLSHASLRREAPAIRAEARNACEPTAFAPQARERALQCEVIPKAWQPHRGTGQSDTR